MHVPTYERIYTNQHCTDITLCKCKFVVHTHSCYYDLLLSTFEIIVIIILAASVLSVYIFIKSLFILEYFKTDLHTFEIKHYKIVWITSDIRTNAQRCLAM